MEAACCVSLLNRVCLRVCVSSSGLERGEDMAQEAVKSGQ